MPPRTAVALDEIIALDPVEEGVAEILGYLSLDDDGITVDTTDDEMTIDYTDAAGSPRRVRMRKALVRRA